MYSIVIINIFCRKGSVMSGKTARSRYSFNRLWLLPISFAVLLSAVSVHAQLNEKGVQLVLEGNQACEKGNYEKAIIAYQKALTGYNIPSAAFNLGITYEINLKDREQAIFYYKKFLQLEPVSDDAKHVQQWIKEIQAYIDNTPIPNKQKPKKLEKNIGPEPTTEFTNDKKLTTDKTALVQEYLKQGNLSAMQGNFLEAIEHYKKVLTIHESSDAYYNLGLIYSQKLNQNDQAHTYYKKFLEMEPDSPEADEIKAWIQKVDQNK